MNLLLFPKTAITKLSNVIFIILIVSVFLNVFEPFGISKGNGGLEFMVKIAGYGMASGLGALLYYGLFQPLIVQMTSLRVRLLLGSAVLLVLIVFANSLYYSIVFRRQFELIGVDKMFYSVLTLTPIVVLGYLFFSKKWVEASLLSSTYRHPNQIIFQSFYQEEPLKLDFNSFLYAVKQQNYVTIFYKDLGKVRRRIMRLTLKEVRKNLKNQQILECHRSYIVNGTRVQDVKRVKGKTYLSLFNIEQEIPVSRLKSSEVYKQVRKLQTHLKEFT